MIRPFFTEVALFLAPFVLYAVFLFATRAQVFHPAQWPLARIGWLFIAAFLLMISSFVVLSHFSGAPPGATYTPARVDENGNFIPGETK